MTKGDSDLVAADRMAAGDVATGTGSLNVRMDDGGEIGDQLEEAAEMGALDAEEAISDSPGVGKPLTGPVPLSKADKRWLRKHRFALHTSDDDEIQPIRLGGRRVLQLRTTRHAPGGDDEEFKKEPQEPIAFEEIAELPDSEWQKVASAAGLTSFEQRVFLALYRDGVPFYKLHTVLRRTKAAVRKAYRSIQTKLFNQSAAGSLILDRARNSRSVVYLERLDSGKLVLSMGRLDQTFRDIMRGENCLISERDPSDLNAADEKAWFSSLKVRGVLLMLPVAAVTKEEIRSEVEQRFPKGNLYGNSREWIESNIEGYLERRHREQTEQAERDQVSVLHDAELAAALSKAEAEHHDAMERWQAAKDRVAEMRREFAANERQPASVASMDEIASAVYKRIEAGLTAALKECDELEAAVNLTAFRLSLLREESAFRRGKAKAEAASKTAPKIQAAIGKAVTCVDGITPSFKDVADLTERALLARVTSDLIALKQYQERKGLVA